MFHLPEDEPKAPEKFNFEFEKLSPSELERMSQNFPHIFKIDYTDCIGALRDEVRSFRCEIRGEKFVPSKRHHLSAFSNRANKEHPAPSSITSLKDNNTFPGRKERHLYKVK